MALIYSIPKFNGRGMKVAHLNIHSVVCKIDELRHLLKLKPFDVICLNETLCDSTISDDEISIDGFTIVRKDRTRHGGGVAVYISNHLTFTRRFDIESENLEIIWLEVKYGKCAPILVGSVYTETT